MPIMSYLVYPRTGRKEELMTALQAMHACEVYPARDHDLLVLVTDTEGKEEEESLQKQLHRLRSVDFLALVSGFSDPERKSVGLIQ